MLFENIASFKIPVQSGAFRCIPVRFGFIKYYQGPGSVPERSEFRSGQMSFQDDNRLVILGLLSTNEIIETTLNVLFENVP